MKNQFTELQEKWLQALESGRYKQVQKKLCYNGGYCCLGVATKIFDPDHGALRKNSWFISDYLDEYEEIELEEYGPPHMTCPPDVGCALNLYHSEGRFRFGAVVKGESSLIALNDELGLTFPEIAAEIRKAPHLVFTNFDQPAYRVKE